jgi:hypothetical protein
MKRAFGPALLAALLALVPWVAPAQQTERALIHDSVVPDIEDNPLVWPTGVASASADEIMVADARDTRLIVLRFESGAWTVAAEIELAGAPVGLGWDGNRYAVSLRNRGGLYAVEGEPRVLRRFSLPADAIPGPLSGVPGGGWLVYDYASGAVLGLDASGASSGRTPVDGHPTALAAAPGGGFYATFADRAELCRYGAGGQLLDRWPIPGRPPVPAWPAGMALTPAGDLAVTDRHNGRLLLIDGGGRVDVTGSRAGWMPGRLRFPSAVALLEDGRIAVVDQGNGRLQLFREVRTGDGS